MARKEGFEDVLDVTDSQQGIFGEPTLDGGSAFAEYAKAKTSVQQGGMAVHFKCEGCGRPRTAVLSFPELIAIKYGIQPQIAYGPLIQSGQMNADGMSSWGYDQEHQMWFPDLRCGCSWPLRPLISVPEATSAINSALSRGWLPMNVEKQLSNFCFQRRGG